MRAQQCCIYWADLNPTKGSEQSGVRPVVVISGNTLNEGMPICIACPVSSKVKKYPTCVTLAASKQSGLTQDSEVLTFQVRALSQSRLTKRIGTITPTELRQILSGLGDIFVL